MSLHTAHSLPPNRLVVTQKNARGNVVKSSMKTVVKKSVQGR